MQAIKSKKGLIALPALKGMQAGMTYFTAMCPLEYVAGIFKYTDDSLSPQMRSQRTLNKGRIPEMRDYILNNPCSYTFSALTASIDGDYDFEENKENGSFGMLRISASARIIINDGQHRREALIQALKYKPELRFEEIAIVFYCDRGLERSQQIFSDLNRYAIRPTKSLSILYDNREQFSILVRECVEEVETFKGNIELEKTTISNRSKNLFTLSGIYYASQFLLRGLNMDQENYKKFIINFFCEVEKKIQIWQIVKNKGIQPCDFRKEHINAHTIFLKAIALVGNALYRKYGQDYLMKLDGLSEIDFRKDNPELQGIVMTQGKMVAATANTKLLAEFILRKLKEEIQIDANKR